MRTDEGTLSSLKSVKNAYMQSHMDFEAASARVAFVAGAESARKRLLSRVGELVSLQMAFSDELALADLARERTFSSMGPHVCF